MTTCKVCGAEIAKSAKVCPNCGAKRSPGVVRIIVSTFLIIIGIGMIGAGLGGMSKGKTPSSSTKDITTEVLAADLELVGGEESLTVSKEQFAWYFSGVVKNNKSKDLSYCQIEINLYDADGNLLGTAVDNVNNLKSGGTWKFKAMTLLSSDELKSIASWELGDIVGY